MGEHAEMARGRILAIVRVMTIILSKECVSRQQDICHASSSHNADSQ